MKCLTLFVHAAVEDDVLNALRALPEVSGFTVSPCQGHSTSTELDPFLATRDRVAGFVPRVRIEVVLEDEVVEVVLERLRRSMPNLGSSGAWLVTNVEASGRL